MKNTKIEKAWKTAAPFIKHYKVSKDGDLLITIPFGDKKYAKDTLTYLETGEWKDQ